MLYLQQERPFAKNCPNKAQSMKLINYLSKRIDFDLEEDDVESIFSLEDEPILNTILVTTPI